MKRRSNVLPFAQSRQASESDEDLRKVVADLWADAMPLDARRLSRVANLFRQLDPEAENELFDKTPRELEVLAFGKQGRARERYFDAAAAEFIRRTHLGQLARAVRADIVDRLVIKHSITRPYATRRLKEARDELVSKSAK